MLRSCRQGPGLIKSALEEALVLCERAANQETIDLDEVAAAQHKILSLMHDRNYDLANES